LFAPTDSLLQAFGLGEMIFDILSGEESRESVYVRVLFGQTPEIALTLGGATAGASEEKTARDED
jgi:hypothetical protein